MAGKGSNTPASQVLRCDHCRVRLVGHDGGSTPPLIFTVMVDGFGRERRLHYFCAYELRQRSTAT